MIAINTQASPPDGSILSVRAPWVDDFIDRFRERYLIACVMQIGRTP
jgi:hypothetical protein